MSARIDFLKLSDEIKGDVVTAEHPEYESAIARWAVNSQRRAKVVVFVKDEHDVSVSIKFAHDKKLPIAIRGGGHSTTGASSCDDGLVIDLSRHMNGSRIDPEKRLAFVGGGAIWEVVDKSAIKHGLATVGGTVNHTGVGGLLLGGGYGFLSPSYGLAIDNLVQATIVTANGSVLTASENENSDLFFGIRGGGCNFGVATEFVLKLYPQRSTVFSGLLIFPKSSLEAILAATLKWWPNAGEKEAMLQMTTVGPDGVPIIVIYPFFNGSESEGRQVFKPFFDIGPVADLAKEIPYEELNTLQNPMAQHGNGQYLKGLAHMKPDFATISKAHERVIEVCKAGVFQANIIYEYYPLAKVNSVPKNATAFRRESTSSVLVALTWNGKLGDRSTDARAIAYEITGIISGSLTQLTKSQTLGYSNYDSEVVNNEVDKAKLTFGENYPRLQQIKKQYDPDNIFNKWFPITPA